MTPTPPQADDARDAARYRELCRHPDWRFIERLCLQFAAKSESEFKAGMDTALDAVLGQTIHAFSAIEAKGDHHGR